MSQPQAFGDAGQGSLALRWPQALTLGLIALGWSAVVALGLNSHEFWRDEVRALSLALQADHLWQLPAAVQGEGHPLLWSALLYIAHALWPVPQVLPLVSIVCAAAAVALFLVRSPFAWWWKLLFTFGALPVYEYVVMARNYGISMLLMFGFAALLVTQRPSPVMLGGVLFLLAQTNVHSALLVPLLAAVWLAQQQPLAAANRDQRLPTAVGLVLAGIGLLCTLLEVYPSRHTLLVCDLRHTAYAGGQTLRGLALAVLEPGFLYRKLTLLPTLPGTLLLYAAIGGLVRRPVLMLAALLGLWSNAALFALVYAGELRHQGVWFCLLVVLYWIALADHGQAARPPGRATAQEDWRWPVWRAGIGAVMPLMLATQCAAAYHWVQFDLLQERSKTAALARVVSQDPTLRAATVVAQPDECVETVPYYLENPTYLLREHRPGNTTTWSTALPVRMELADVLQQVRQLKAQRHQPVVLLLCHRWPADSGEVWQDEGWGRVLHATATDIRQLRDSSKPLSLGADADPRENFDAYVFR